MRRVLVLSASVGAGHLRAAEAVELALREADPRAEVLNADVLALTGAIFRRVYAKAYLDLVNRAPHLLGYMYDLTDRPRRPTRRGDQLRRMVHGLNLSRIIELLEGPWDAVINTHFLSAQIMALRRRRRRASVPQYTVVTDFDAHAFWVNDPTDGYFVATQEAALSLERWGVDPARVEITGIPIHPAFAREHSAAACRAGHGLDPGAPVVLLLAGGFGVGPVERVYRELLGVRVPLQVVVVSGRNAALRARLQRIAVPRMHAARVLGYTSEMDELMSAADLVVGKPGGLTTSEVLASGCAMAIVNPIPGQESRNSDYLLENGAAVKINSLAALRWKLETLVRDRERLGRLKAAARGLGRPLAARDVAERVLSRVG